MELDDNGRNQEARALKQKLGMPSDAIPMFIDLPDAFIGAGTWAGYRVEVFGRLYDGVFDVLPVEEASQLVEGSKDRVSKGGSRVELQGFYDTPDATGVPHGMFIEHRPASYPWPHLTMGDITPGVGDPDMVLQIWRQRARYENDPIISEITWDPVHGRDEVFVGLPLAKKMTDLTKPWRGLLLLRARIPQGRTPDARDSDAAKTFRARVSEIIDFLNGKNIEPSRETVAEQYGVTSRQLFRLAKQFGPGWKALKLELEREHLERNLRR
jgi:hypothetical protein